MAQKSASLNSWLQASVVRVCRVQFTFAALYAAIIVASDAWNLIPPTVVLQRWTMGALLLGVTTIVWYAARVTTPNVSYYKLLIMAILALDIALATFSVYSQRGMSSRGVMLYALPIIISGVLLTRSAIYATAAISTAAYVLAAVHYFYIHPGEGYKVELYAELTFYCVVFFILAALIWSVVRSKKP